MHNIYYGTYKDKKRYNIATLSKLLTCVICEKQRFVSFFIQDLHLNFQSFLGFQLESGSSVKAIMLLSSALPLAIGLKFFGL